MRSVQKTNYNITEGYQVDAIGKKLKKLGETFLKALIKQL